MTTIVEQSYRTEAEGLKNLSALQKFLLRKSKIWMSSVLVVSDLTGILLAGFLAVLIRSLFPNPGIEPIWYLQLVPLSVLFTVVFFLRGLYPGLGLDEVEEFRRLTINTSFVYLSVLFFSYILHSSFIGYSRFIFLTSAFFAVIFLPFMRFAVRSLLIRLNSWGEPVAVMGTRQNVTQVSRFLLNHPICGIIPVPTCDDISRMREDGEDCHAGEGDSPLQEARATRWAVVIYSAYEEIALYQKKYQNQFERMIYVNQKDLGGILYNAGIQKFGEITGMVITDNLQNRWQLAFKRILDAVFSFLTLLALSPFLGITALLIALDSPGPVFYRQPRLGYNGKTFGILKFRTMHTNADDVLEDYLEQDETLRAEWVKYQKLRNDPRITRIGRILRRSSMDELPQLLNVFFGDMSIVGPRPILLNQIDLYGECIDHYVRVRPGITGLWQISGRNNTTFTRRVEYDVQYVHNWSIWMDFYIFIRTFWTVISSDGAG